MFIQQALYAGCLSSWSHGNMDVDVLFYAHAKSSSKYFIQFNMEQMTNKRLFDDVYRGKLRRATAVWDWSRENIHSMRSFLRAEQLNMVPLWLAMAPPSKERGRCEGGHSITAADLCPRVYTFQYNRMVQCRIGNCATSDVVERECPATDVQFALFFGHCQLERRG